jgi:tricorn protease
VAHPAGLRSIILLLALAAGLLTSAAVPQGQGYHRFPTIHGDTVVFTAEGDLWKVGIAGGVAQRLTTIPGSEARAAVSSDGTTVAFSAT